MCVCVRACMRAHICVCAGVDRGGGGGGGNPPFWGTLKLQRERDLVVNSYPDTPFPKSFIRPWYVCVCVSVCVFVCMYVCEHVSVTNSPDIIGS